MPECNRQGDSPESLIITPPHLLAALVAIVAPLITPVQSSCPYFGLNFDLNIRLVHRFNFLLLVSFYIYLTSGWI